MTLGGFHFIFALSFSSSPTETWTYSEKQIFLDDQITMRERRFGLIEIYDENIAQFFDATSCHPANITATPEMVFCNFI